MMKDILDTKHPLEEYFKRLDEEGNEEIIKLETKGINNLLQIMTEQKSPDPKQDIESLFIYTVKYGTPPYPVRINYPLSFLAKNPEYVKAVFNIYRKSTPSCLGLSFDDLRCTPEEAQIINSMKKDNQ